MNHFPYLFIRRFHVSRLFVSLVALTCISGQFSRAEADDLNPNAKAGAWHYRSIPCVDTRVTEVTPRLGEENQKTFSHQDFVRTGVVVHYASHLGVDPLVPRLYASVTHYPEMPGNTIMMTERPGDRVQLCFLGAPAPTNFCDPDIDSRGRMYRVYDYRRRTAYAGENEEHSCGGA
jgi:hypothetical protein